MGLRTKRPTAKAEGWKAPMPETSVVRAKNPTSLDALSPLPDVSLEGVASLDPISDELAMPQSAEEQAQGERDASMPGTGGHNFGRVSVTPLGNPSQPAPPSGTGNRFAVSIRRDPDLMSELNMDNTAAVTAVRGHSFGNVEIVGGFGDVELPDSSVGRAARSNGQSLPPDIRGHFERSIGMDLGQVRVHTDADSAHAARAIGAKAYAIGQDIHFSEGRYAPVDPAGARLLAHEIAHTVQQRGVTAHNQHDLEVSTPQDSMEIEADRVSDAMMAGVVTSVGAGPLMLARTLETDEAAAEGQQQMMTGPAKADIVLQVSNATDLSDATKALAMLEREQVKIEKGAAMISPHQRNQGDSLQNKAQGKENKPLTQIPLEAIGENAAVIADLNLYITEAGGQDMVTSQFQDQYRALQGNFGRLEGIAQSFGVTSFKEMKKEDAGAMVSDAVASGGHTTEDLAATFDDLAKNVPAVAEARGQVELTTQALEKMPERVSSDMTTCVDALQAFRTNVLNATVAEKGVNSLKLRNAFAAAKAKSEEAKRLTGAAKDLVMTGGKEALSTVAKGVVGAGAMSLSKWGALAASGAASGGTAVAAAAAEKLVIAPAKEMIGQALTDANIAVGVIEPEAQVEADLDAEKAKQDSATIESFKLAKAALANSSAAAVGTVSTFVKTAVEFESAKIAVTQAFTRLSDAIKSALAAKGKGSEGKALAEMAGFLNEAEQFVVQANAVIDIATKGIGVGAADANTTIPAKARAALRKIQNRYCWMTHEYPFTKASGETVTYYGAQRCYLKLVGPGLDATADDLAGKGRADGFNDPLVEGNKQAVNEAIPGIVPSLVTMRDKVLAVRAEIAAQVFGGAAK